ncbi:uncharacterized protein TNCV_313371 [Trichonephila clavipes]|nr:uncharacterized protein TNCV_313371 [Trichonephila clavipes]
MVLRKHEGAIGDKLRYFEPRSDDEDDRHSTLRASTPCKREDHDRFNVPDVATERGSEQAAVAEWYRYQTMACLVTSLSPLPLKTRRVGQRFTLNLSRAETSSRWCSVVVRRGWYQLRCRPRLLTMVQNYVVRRQKPSSS